MTHDTPARTRLARAMTIFSLTSIVIGVVLWLIFLVGVAVLVWQQVIE